MKKKELSGAACWAIFLVLLVFVVSLVKKDERPSGGVPASGATSSVTESDLKYAGRERLKAQLRDPGSLQIIEERIEYREGHPHYHARYRAKNGFGGYTIEDYTTE